MIDDGDVDDDDNMKLMNAWCSIQFYSFNLN